MALPSPHLQSFQTGQARWRAITSRDPAAHCSFIYGVTSTKIYCRPTCTARVARRANVVYYETRQQAEADGFRPCSKCKPDESSFMGQREEVVMRTLDFIRRRKDCLQVEGGLKELAKNVGVTPSYLCRVFKKTMGCTIGQYCKDFEVAACDKSDTWSSVGSSRTAESEASPSELPVNAFSPPPSFASLAASMSEPSIELLGRSEELSDLDFDFSEWAGEDGFNINDWIVPDTGFQSDHATESGALRSV